MATEKELERWAEEQTERENQRALSGKSQTTGSISIIDALAHIKMKESTASSPGEAIGFNQDALDFERMCLKHGFLKRRN